MPDVGTLKARFFRRIIGSIPKVMVDFLYRHRFSPVVRHLKSVGKAGLGDPTDGIPVTHGPIAGYRFAFSDSMAMWMGGHETAVVDEIQRQLRPGMTAYDIGAHVGYMVLVMAKIVGPSGRIVAYEPDAENRALLGRNIGINGMGPIVEVSPAALGRQRGRADLMRGEISGNTQVEESLQGGIEVTTLDDEVLEQGRPSPDLILVDAEGAEESIFYGGMKVLSQYGPIIVCEDHGRRDALIKQLTPVGYRNKAIDTDHSLFWK